MRIHQIRVGHMQNFCYLIGDPVTEEGVVVDPGFEGPSILEAAKKAKIRIKYILNTHCHFDHTGANKDIKEATGSKIVIHREDARYLKHFTPPPADIETEDGQIIELGKMAFKFIHTPGHSPGSCLIHVDGSVMTGDTLFVGSIGRCDLPGGSPEAMYRSLQTRVLALPRESVIFPGHDYGHSPTSTLEREMKENPYLNCPSLDAFVGMTTGGYGL
ncbi:MAG: MBL fold metallo-hydrolase [Nitrospirae bacterium]|nr:MBL fold metallo-hydrolase [Nitrospirota bacterium]